MEFLAEALLDSKETGMGGGLKAEFKATPAKKMQEQGGTADYWRPDKTLSASGYAANKNSQDRGQGYEKCQQGNTVVLDDTNPSNSTGEELLGQFSVSSLARAVEEHIYKDLQAEGKDLQLTHGHLLNQTSLAARFNVHVDTEENHAFGKTHPRKARTVFLTAVILLRKGNNYDKGDSGVRVLGATSDAYFKSAGDCHIFPSELWHESVNTFGNELRDDHNKHGDLKLTLFWGWEPSVK